MLREKWEFEYTGAQLCEAAGKRVAFHQDRLKWWKDKRQAVMAQIRAEGIEVNESIAMGYQNPKSRDWVDSTQVLIRNDLKLARAECQKKLASHAGRLAEFSGWFQVLKANPEARKPLDLQDWLYFFTEGSNVDDPDAAGGAPGLNWN